MSQVQTLLRLPDVTQHRGVSRATHYKEVRHGLMTRPVRVHARLVGWPAAEIDAINRARIAGKSEAEIRELVKRLEAERLMDRCAA